MSEQAYIHGYSSEEQARLISQNETLAGFIYENIDFSLIHHVLEIGSGVGAQMIYLLQKYPHLRITGIDISAAQIAQAKHNLALFPALQGRYTLHQIDATNLAVLQENNFDAALMVWVLEHVPQPLAILQAVKQLLVPNTPIFITEVLHNNFYVYPDAPNALAFWQKTIQFQYTLNGDANIGARLGNLLYDADFQDIKVKPYPMLFDKTQVIHRQKMLRYWLELMQSAVPAMLAANYIEPILWEKAAQEMTALLDNENAVYFYAFMQAFAKA